MGNRARGAFPAHPWGAGRIHSLEIASGETGHYTRSQSARQVLAAKELTVVISDDRCRRSPTRNGAGAVVQGRCGTTIGSPVVASLGIACCLKESVTSCASSGATMRNASASRRTRSSACSFSLRTSWTSRICLPSSRGRCTVLCATSGVKHASKKL